MIDGHSLPDCVARVAVGLSVATTHGFPHIKTLARGHRAHTHEVATALPERQHAELACAGARKPREAPAKRRAPARGADLVTRRSRSKRYAAGFHAARRVCRLTVAFATRAQAAPLDILAAQGGVVKGTAARIGSGRLARVIRKRAVVDAGPDQWRKRIVAMKKTGNRTGALYRIT